MSKKKETLIQLGGDVFKLKNNSGKKKKSVEITEAYPNLGFGYLLTSSRCTSGDKQTDLNMDEINCAMYVELQKSKFYGNEINAFSREFRSNSLITTTGFDGLIQKYTMASMCAIKKFYPAYFYKESCSEDKCFVRADEEDFDFVPIIIPVKEKPGYFKLEKNAEPFPGLTKTVSNYIIDNAAALIRILTFRFNDEMTPNVIEETHKFVEHIRKHPGDKFSYGSIIRLISGIPANCFYPGENAEDSFDLGILAENMDKIKNPDVAKWVRELDIRKCINGDIETLLINSNSILSAVFTINQFSMLEMNCRWYTSPRFISSLYPIRMYIITNPYKLYGDSVCVNDIINEINRIKEEI